MLELNFSDNYDIVHLTPEFGESSVGGICTFINELYSQRDKNWGFIQIYGENADTINENLYAGIENDALVLGLDETELLEHIQCKTFVIHLWALADFITETILKDKNIVYVIHAIPTVEPCNVVKPFEDTYTQKSFEFMCNVAKMLICVSHSEKEKLIQLYPQHKDKIQVIYNGINIHDVDKTNQNYIHSRNNFGYIGRIDARKGVYELVKYLNKHDAHLSIATGNPSVIEMQRIIEYINATKSLDKVDFLGWSYGERKNNFFQSIDALIIPSLYEPFGYIALEAMKYGVPVISCQNGGLKEILGENYRYLFNIYDEASFDRAIETFMNDSVDVVDKQVTHLRNRLNNFTVEKMTQNYKQVLDDFITKYH